MDHTIATHNGEITMHNPETGQHRTIRIKTQPNDANFAPGERIAYLLNGHDNERDYLPFAFVGNDGAIRVWRRYRGEGKPSNYELLARMIQNPAPYEKRGITYQFSTTCRRCNRLLTTPTSIANGIGPICAEKQ